MFKVDKYPHGHFSWADGQSTDVAKTKAFYTDLMGWTYDDIPMGDGMFYTMFKAQGEYIAGVGQMQPDMQAQGIPSHWTSYVNVDDVDAITAKVADLGGTVLMGPFDIEGSGRMAVLQDPQGATVGLWQPKGHKGAGLVNTPGAMCWNELTTTDTKGALDFYTKLLGWTYSPMEGMEYHVIMNNNRPNGGIMPKPAEMGDAPPLWTVYYSVADIDKTFEKAKAIGGMVIGDNIMDAGDIGRFAVILDPTGMAAIFMQMKEPQPWEG